MCRNAKEYDKLALPARDLRFWRCQQCGWSQDRTILKPIVYQSEKVR